jgi:hypothetical protein
MGFLGFLRIHLEELGEVKELIIMLLTWFKEGPGTVFEVKLTRSNWTE